MDALAGHDEEVQREEERLVDPQALKALCGGTGESYRQSLQALLSQQPEGLTFAQAVQALRERQGHDVPRNTVRAILYAGAFPHRDGRWFAAPQSEHGGRSLRAALADALVANQQSDLATTPISQTERRRKQVQAIRTRLAELLNVLHENLQSAD